jgi:hypothetical protein
MLHTTRRLRFTTREHNLFLVACGILREARTPHHYTSQTRGCSAVVPTCSLPFAAPHSDVAHTKRAFPQQAHEADTISAHALAHASAHEALGTFCFRGLENSLCERLAPGMLFCVHWEFDTRSLSPLRRLVQQALPAPDCFFCSQPGFPQREIVGARRERDFKSEGSTFFTSKASDKVQHRVWTA